MEKRWETHVDMAYSSNPEELYTRGNDGWELVTVIQWDGNWRFYWKRECTNIESEKIGAK